jgi:hypothetical protein
MQALPLLQRSDLEGRALPSGSPHSELRLLTQAVQLPLWYSGSTTAVMVLRQYNCRYGNGCHVCLLSGSPSSGHQPFARLEGTLVACVQLVCASRLGCGGGLISLVYNSLLSNRIRHHDIRNCCQRRLCCSGWACLTVAAVLFVCQRGRV